MIRTFVETIEPTPTELADSFWEMDNEKQVTVLHALYHRFCIIPEVGEMQMAEISSILSTKPAKYKAEVIEFVSKLYDFLKE